jgi:hypothetical protein
MTERAHDDLELDKILEMIEEENSDDNETSSHQHSPTEDVEPEKESYRDNKDNRESADAKLAYETMNSNVQLKQQLEQMRAAKEEAEQIALQGVLRSFDSQIESSESNINHLNQALASARDEGDTSKSIEIESKIRDNYERIRDLKGKVDQYSPILNQSRRQPEPQVAQATEGNKMAAEWLRDNERWLTDPTNIDKRDFANNKFKEMQANNMDMSSLGFWTKFEKSLAEFDHKKSNDRNNRMPKNMVTYNPNGSNSNSSKPLSYKSDPNFVKNVAHIAKNLIKNEDTLKDSKMLNSMLKHYHKVYKAGNFKHIPTSMN